MKAIRDFDIAELDNQSPHMPIVARWLNEEWGKSQGYDLSDTSVWCNQLACATNETIIIAMSNGRLVGTVSVVECDLEGREDLRPWLSNLFVPSQDRRKRVGQALIESACNWAWQRRFVNLYLYVRQGRLTAYYSELGWLRMGAFDLDGVTFELMQKVLLETAAEA